MTEYAEVINAARDDGTPCVVATQGVNGVPDISLKGSVVVFDSEHLAYWERSLGQQYANLEAGPGIAVLSFNRTRGKLIRAFGHAELHRDGPVREQIMALAPQAELDMDPERKGVGVLIRVDRFVEAFSRTTQERESAG
jgi:hypothetical protein